MPKRETFPPGDERNDADFTYDELAYAFPEHQNELPQAHPAPWGIFDKARQALRSLIIM